MIVRVVVVLGVLLPLAACSGGGSAKHYSSDQLERLLVARARTHVPGAWEVSRQSDGPKNDGAEELFFSTSDDKQSVKVSLGTTSAGPSQGLNVQVDKQAMPAAVAGKISLRTRTATVTADRFTGYDTINKATLTHVEYTAGPIVVSVLGADEALTVRIARAQAATLPPEH